MKPHPIIHPLRLAMIGGGPGAGIGRVHRLAARMDGVFELVAGAFSSSPEKSLAMGSELGLSPERVYASPEEMLDKESALPDGVRPDLIAIVTPNHLHFHQAKMALERGFHIIVEKPMTMNLAEAVELRDIARVANRFVAVAHGFSANSVIKLARDLVRQGRLGSLKKIQVEYPAGWLSQPVEKANDKQALWRTDPALAGSGCLGDIGTHAANLAETVSGLRLTSLSADIGTIVQGRKVDDDAAILCRWEGGVRGTILASQAATGVGNELSIRIYGDKAGLEWRYTEMNYLILRREDGVSERIPRGSRFFLGNSPAAARVSRFTNHNSECYIENFANIYFNLAASIRARKAGSEPSELERDFPNADDGVRGMAFIQSALDSAARNAAWVTVPHHE